MSSPTRTPTPEIKKEQDSGTHLPPPSHAHDSTNPAPPFDPFLTYPPVEHVGRLSHAQSSTTPYFIVHGHGDDAEYEYVDPTDDFKYECGPAPLHAHDPTNPAPLHAHDSTNPAPPFDPFLTYPPVEHVGQLSHAQSSMTPYFIVHGHGDDAEYEYVDPTDDFKYERGPTPPLAHDPTNPAPPQAPGLEHVGQVSHAPSAGAPLFIVHSFGDDAEYEYIHLDSPEGRQLVAAGFYLPSPEDYQYRSPPIEMLPATAPSSPVPSTHDLPLGPQPLKRMYCIGDLNNAAEVARAKRMSNRLPF